jgi:hypothetical protein
MTTKDLAQLRGDYTKAKNHLAFLERCMASGTTRPGSILLATPDMIAVAQAKVVDLERWLADATPQLSLFSLPTP